MGIRDTEYLAEYKTVACAVCASNDHRTLFHLPNVEIVACKHCGLEYVNPIPRASVVEPYVFSPLDYESLGTEIDLCYLRKIFEIYHLVNCRLLDLGCGAGRLEPGLIRAGWEQKNLYLVDSCDAALNTAQLMCPSANLILRDAETGIGFVDFFDCILMEEFFEDLTNPPQVMRNALNALRRDGFLIMRGMPNNESIEAFVGRDKWKMRALAHHFNFFNPRTFSRFLDNFPQARLLEFGCFLQKGYHFYHSERIARDLGLLEGIGHGHEQMTTEDTLTQDEVAQQVWRKLNEVDFEAYPHQRRFPRKELATLSTAQAIKAFFDKIHLDYVLAPDFSVVIRKIGA